MVRRHRRPSIELETDTVELVEPVDSIEEISLVVSRPAPGLMLLLGAVAVGSVAAFLWTSFVAPTQEPQVPPETATLADAHGSGGGPDDDDDDVSMDRAEERQPLPWVASPTPPGVPLFPGSPGLTLATPLPGGGIGLIDATTGERIPFAVRSEGPGPHTPTLSALVGRIDDLLVVRSDARAIGYPLGGGDPIRFGEADTIVLTEELVVLVSEPPEGNGAKIVSGFLGNGRATGNIIQSASTGREFDLTGYVVGADGSHVFTGDGFERQTEHAIVASGPNHVVESRCAGAGPCDFYRVELETFEATRVELDANFDWIGNGLSADGRWLSTYVIDDGGDVTYRLIEVDTGDFFELPRPVTEVGEPTAFRWDPTGRYAILGGIGRLLIFDVVLAELRLLKASDIGLSSVLGGVLAFPLEDVRGQNDDSVRAEAQTPPCSFANGYRGC